MTLLKWKIMGKKKKGKKLTSDGIGMLAVYDKPTDFTKKEYINEIIAYITGENQIDCCQPRSRDWQ